MLAYSNIIPIFAIEQINITIMEKDKKITEVIFRVDTTKDFKGTVFALLPYQIERNGSVTSYQHVGQHSTANYDWCVKSSKLAKESEYTYLKKEMESLGYNIKVIKKRNYTKFLNEYRKIN